MEIGFPPTQPRGATTAVTGGSRGIIKAVSTRPARDVYTVIVGFHTDPHQAALPVKGIHAASNSARAERVDDETSCRPVVSKRFGSARGIEA